MSCGVQVEGSKFAGVEQRSAFNLQLSTFNLQLAAV